MENNFNHRKWVFRILIGLAILSLFFYLFNEISNKSSKIKEQNNLINSLYDTVQVWKDEDGKNRAKISVLKTSKTQDFLRINTQDSTIKELQSLVSKYKNKLNDGSSVTIIKGSTKFDTIYETKETIKYLLGDISIVDTINNDWITSVFGFKRDSTIFSLKVKNDLSLIIGEDSQGWFKPKIPFAEVINNNPYAETDVLRTYKVTDTRPNFNIKSALIGGVTGVALIGLLSLLLNFY